MSANRSRLFKGGFGPNSAYELIQRVTILSPFSLVAIGNVLSHYSLNLKSDFRAKDIQCLKNQL
ncbi:hypothetical protein VCR3J2_70208 [Vibrio coralliirubri]|nr:hypothetical protein VCR15J2_90016 [Vibrio coralliirubri]CDT91261.1 hypothetical protein VCR12J2_1390095 [Vibrio coralliirubri]CDU03124.1 hypothetical protein VCR3J2_70208 [Vibrio coralliirubri]CDU13908.1 hypothetical protein VCR17J2_60213 [Vibrio coralliirubri]